MLSKYIKELIANNNRIIIPDFGAFMIQETPEGKKISFNDFLKFNDGLLVNQIIKAERIGKNESVDKIKEFIKVIEDAFSQNNVYELEGVGFLFADENGNVKFSEVNPSNKTATSTKAKPDIVSDKGKEPAKKETPLKKEEKPKVQPKVQPKTEPNKVIASAASTAKPSSEAKESTAKSTTVKSSSATKVTAAKRATANSAAKVTVNKQAASAVDNSKKENKEEKNNKKGGGFILLILAILVFLGVMIWAIIHFDVFNKIFGDKTETTVVEQPEVVVVHDSVPTTDTISEITTNVDSIAEAKLKEKEEPKVDPNAKKYYIVAGCFMVPSNAKNFNQKLIEEGYNSEIIVKSNGYHIVSYKVFYDSDKAKLELRNMRNINGESWIMVK